MQQHKTWCNRDKLMCNRLHCGVEQWLLTSEPFKNHSSAGNFFMSKCVHTLAKTVHTHKADDSKSTPMEAETLPKHQSVTCLQKCAPCWKESTRPENSQKSFHQSTTIPLSAQVVFIAPSSFFLRVFVVRIQRLFSHNARLGLISSQRVDFVTPCGSRN